MTKYKKTRDIKLRFLHDEYLEVWRRKEAHGLSFTDYGRFTMLGPHASKKFPDRKALAAILLELGKLTSLLIESASDEHGSRIPINYNERDIQKILHNVEVIRKYISKAVKL